MRGGLCADRKGDARGVAAELLWIEASSGLEALLVSMDLVICRGFYYPARLVTCPTTCPEVLFTLEEKLPMMFRYAEPLLLPTTRKKPRYAAGRFVRKRV